MADLGKLDDYQDDHDLTFEFAGRKFEITASVEQVLTYQRKYAAYLRKLNTLEASDRDALNAASHEEIATKAPLLGGRYNTETGLFEAGNKGEANHDLIPTLIELGIKADMLLRLVSVAGAKYFYGDDVSEDLIKHGNLGKALQNVADQQKSEETPSPATPPTTGETPTDDSETQAA